MARVKPLLTAQHILDKEFRVDTKGYRMTEVDVFLDAVCEDYNLYEEKIARLVRELNEERAKNLTLEQEVSRLSTKVELSRDTVDANQETNVDLLKRLSELEKMVYNNKK